MGKESKKGSDFYKAKGLKPITLHLTPTVHQKLIQLSKTEERSIQITARRILEAYLNRR